MDIPVTLLISWANRPLWGLFLCSSASHAAGAASASLRQFSSCRIREGSFSCCLVWHWFFVGYREGYIIFTYIWLIFMVNVGNWIYYTWMLWDYIPGTLKHRLFKWLFQLDDSKSLHKEWLVHQTSITKWLFRVPGLCIYLYIYTYLYIYITLHL